MAGYGCDNPTATDGVGIEEEPLSAPREDEYGEPPTPDGVCWAIIGWKEGVVGRADAGLRRRRKNNNTPKTANPATAPMTPPAITPAFVFVAMVGGLAGLLFIVVGIVSEVVLDIVKVGE
jgi:hypothetical protein